MEQVYPARIVQDEVRGAGIPMIAAGAHLGGTAWSGWSVRWLMLM